MKKATFFISDLHLEETKPKITQAFLQFLEEIQPQALALYILGDFFEAWIGDDENTPLQVEIKQAIRLLSNNGTDVFLMHGNRDFLIGQQFEEETGATLLNDPVVINLYGQPTLLMHGDSLCVDDKEYMKFRKNMRNESWQKSFLVRPLIDRQTTAQQLRTISQIKNKGKTTEIMDVSATEVIRIMTEFNVRQLIHGHTHRPASHDLAFDSQTGIRMVLGDWTTSFWYAKATNKGDLTLTEHCI